MLEQPGRLLAMIGSIKTASIVVLNTLILLLSVEALSYLALNDGVFREAGNVHLTQKVIASSLNTSSGASSPA
jgi:hypothetical protein